MQVGRRLTACSILSGSVVPIWGTLERVLGWHEGALSKSDRSMRAVRVEVENGERLIGIRYPTHLLEQVRCPSSLAVVPDGRPQGLLRMHSASGARPICVCCLRSGRCMPYLERNMRHYGLCLFVLGGSLHAYRQSI